MNRRDSTRTLLGAAGAWAMNPGELWALAPRAADLRIDGPRRRAGARPI